MEVQDKAGQIIYNFLQEGEEPEAVIAALIPSIETPNLQTRIKECWKMVWKDDTELFELMRNELFSAVVGDVLDTMGLFHQFLPPRIQPLREEMRLVGRAMPVLTADYFSAEDASGQTELSRRPFGIMLDALDNLRPNEVYVATGGVLAMPCGVS